jgi:hypothetical protein
MLKSWRMRCAGHVAKRCVRVYRILVGKPEGDRPLGRPKCGYVDIKPNLGELVWGGMDWIGLAQDRGQWRDLVNMVINLRVP